MDLEARMRDRASELFGASLEVSKLGDGTWRAALVAASDGNGDEVQSTTGTTRDEALQNLAFVLDLGV